MSVYLCLCKIFMDVIVSHRTARVCYPAPVSSNDDNLTENIFNQKCLQQITLSRSMPLPQISPVDYSDI